MKKTLGIMLEAVLIFLVAAYISLIIVEYFRYQNDEPMLILLKENVKEYEDGHVYIDYGLGYKSITYERKSIYGKQFGHIFIREKNALN